MTLRIVRGEPTAEELAALTALMTAASADDEVDTAATPQRGGWSDPARRVQAPPRPGPGAWRASFR